MNDQYIIYFLSKTKKRMTSYIANRLKEEGITDIDPSYGNIFTALYLNDGSLSMKEITRFVGKDKSTVTSHIKQLSKAGYITKEQSPADKRVSIISLTEKGWEFEKTYKLISNDIKEIAYEEFSQEDKDTFLALLKKMNNSFKIKE